MENVFPKPTRLENVKHFSFVKTSWELLTAVSKYYWGAQQGYCLTTVLRINKIASEVLLLTCISCSTEFRVSNSFVLWLPKYLHIQSCWWRQSMGMLCLKGLAIPAPYVHKVHSNWSFLLSCTWFIVCSGHKKLSYNTIVLNSKVFFWSIFLHPENTGPYFQ